MQGLNSVRTTSNPPPHSQLQESTYSVQVGPRRAPQCGQKAGLLPRVQGPCDPAGVEGQCGGYISDLEKPVEEERCK